MLNVKRLPGICYEDHVDTLNDKVKEELLVLFENKYLELSEDGYCFVFYRVDELVVEGGDINKRSDTMGIIKVYLVVKSGSEKLISYNLLELHSDHRMNDNVFDTVYSYMPNVLPEDVDFDHFHTLYIRSAEFIEYNGVCYSFLKVTPEIISRIKFLRNYTTSANNLA